MQMERKKIRIGELADHLGVEKFVIRFWEKEFSIQAKRSEGGQRFYRDHDIKKFETIKHLLYDRQFTIAGAKKILENSENNNFTYIAAPEFQEKEFAQNKLNKKLKAVYNQLLQLRKLL